MLLLQLPEQLLDGLVFGQAGQRPLGQAVSLGYQSSGLVDAGQGEVGPGQVGLLGQRLAQSILRRLQLPPLGPQGSQPEPPQGLVALKSKGLLQDFLRFGVAPQVQQRQGADLQGLSQDLLRGGQIAQSPLGLAGEQRRFGGRQPQPRVTAAQAQQQLQMAQRIPHPPALPQHAYQVGSGRNVPGVAAQDLAVGPQAGFQVPAVIGCHRVGFGEGGGVGVLGPAGAEGQQRQEEQAGQEAHAEAQTRGGTSSPLPPSSRILRRCG